MPHSLCFSDLLYFTFFRPSPPSLIWEKAVRVKTFQNLSSSKPEFLTSKLHVRWVRLKRTKFWKRYPCPPKSDRDWPRVVATKVMQGCGGGGVCANLEFLKKCQKASENLTTKMHPDCIIFTFDLFLSRPLLRRAWVLFTEFWPV